ncbi:MAG: hypothetical protein ACI8PZ_005643 [Myxococcota bacterium]|jgi:hypothetical protein
MTARTILAVRTGRSKFKGVFHEQAGEPWVLGDHILSRVIRARGDLDQIVQQLIYDVPWGWVSLPLAEKSVLKKQPNRRLFSQNILAKRDEIEMDWIYLFDLDTRTLTVSSVETAGKNGLSPAPFVVVSFNERGRPNPRQIVAPPPLWPQLPNAEAWEGDNEELAGLRQRSLDVTDAWCAQVGLPAENLAMLMGAALSTLVTSALGTEAEQVYVPAPHSEGQTYWTVELYDTNLHYPSPAWREALRQNDAMYDGDSLEVWAAPNRLAKVVLSPRQILAGYGDLPWSDDLPEQEDTVAAVLRGLAAGLFPRSDIDSDGMRVFRWMKVVEEVEDPDREVRVSAQNDQEAGSEVQNTLLLKWGWDVLDWLRASQLTERVYEDDDEVEYEDDDGEFDDNGGEE